MTINPKYGGTRGYTLVEMMIVMVVMGLMASFGIPRFVHSPGAVEGRRGRAPTSGQSGRPSGSTGWITAPTPADLNCAGVA